MKIGEFIGIGHEMKLARINLKISQKAMALILNIPQSTYSNYENDTLENIVSLRNNYNEQKNMNIKEASKMNNSLNKYLAIVENYPELKANTQYLNLQSELKDIENSLEIARHKYNDEVTKYNTVIESVPSNIVASIFAFIKAELFQIDETKKENIKIEL